MSENELEVNLVEPPAPTAEEIISNLGLSPLKKEVGTVEPEVEQVEEEAQEAAGEELEEEVDVDPRDAEIAKLREAVEELQAAQKAVDEEEVVEEEEEDPIIPTSTDPISFITTIEECENILTDPTQLNAKLNEVYQRAKMDAVKDIYAVLPTHVKKVVDTQLTSKDQTERVVAEFQAAHQEELAPLAANPRLAKLTQTTMLQVQQQHPGWPLKKRLEEGLKQVQELREGFLKAEGGSSMTLRKGVAPNGAATPGSRGSTRNFVAGRADAAVLEMDKTLGLHVPRKR